MSVPLVESKVGKELYTCTICISTNPARWCTYRHRARRKAADRRQRRWIHLVMDVVLHDCGAAAGAHSGINQTLLLLQLWLLLVVLLAGSLYPHWCRVSRDGCLADGPGLRLIDHAHLSGHRGHDSLANRTYLGLCAERKLEKSANRNAMSAVCVR